MMEEPRYHDGSLQEWEQTVHALARTYAYPPTPDIAAAVRRKLAVRHLQPHVSRPAWQRPALVFAALLLALALALSVPAVRAAVREWLQIGAVRIELTPPATGPAVTATEAAPVTTVPVATAALPLDEPLTLAEVQAQADFELRLPTAAPADRPPDRLYLQALPLLSEEQVVIFVWFDPERPGEPILSLYQIASANCCMKGAWASGGAETEVGGEPAYWVEGPHPLSLDGGDNWTIVPGDVLVWTDGRFTFRLESTLGLAETVWVAESIR
jgi:hypothetical protein